MSKQEKAIEIFKDFNCAQSVLGAFSEDLGLDRERALRIASAMGGGMRQGEVCGAVSGALMALGLVYGYCEADPEAKERSNQKTIAFVEQFKLRNGTILCKKLLGYDISIREEQETAAEKGLYDTVCPNVIRDAVDILEQFI